LKSAFPRKPKIFTAKNFVKKIGLVLFQCSKVEQDKTKKIMKKVRRVLGIAAGILFLNFGSILACSGTYYVPKGQLADYIRDAARNCPAGSRMTFILI